MRVVSGGYYNHSKHGRIRVVDVTNSHVRFETSELVYVSSLGKIPCVKQEELERFRERSEPADIELNPPASDVDYDTNNPL